MRCGGERHGDNKADKNGGYTRTREGREDRKQKLYKKTGVQRVGARRQENKNSGYAKKRGLQSWAVRRHLKRQKLYKKAGKGEGGGQRLWGGGR